MSVKVNKNARISAAHTSMQIDSDVNDVKEDKSWELKRRESNRGENKGTDADISI